MSAERRAADREKYAQSQLQSMTSMSVALPCVTTHELRLTTSHIAKCDRDDPLNKGHDASNLAWANTKLAIGNVDSVSRQEFLIGTKVGKRKTQGCFKTWSGLLKRVNESLSLSVRVCGWLAGWREENRMMHVTTT